MSGLGQGFGQIIPPVKKGLDSPPARGMTGEGIDFLVKQGNDGEGLDSAVFLKAFSLSACLRKQFQTQVNSAHGVGEGAH